MEKSHEINFDGLIGPTHNYAGLSRGNLASQQHRAMVSSPRQAALEGLAKMKFLADLGIRQAVLPPHERPDIATLRRLGFGGSDVHVLQTVQKQSPMLLAACCSASAMWAANAATVSPSADTADGRVHFTPANLASQFHRSLEPPTTAAILRTIFADEALFAHHAPLPLGAPLGDEGAANHMRLGPSDGESGIEIFVHGHAGFDAAGHGPRRFPARQTLEASQAVARLHGLDSAQTVFVRQNPAAIDAGAFHNDVVAVANENVLLYHAEAFADRQASLDSIREAYSKTGGPDLLPIDISADDLSLDDAVKSYLFNSQLVSTSSGMALICPNECLENPAAFAAINRVQESGSPIRSVHFIPVRQSMQNGGGPACLRLRVVLNEREMSAVAPGVFLTDTLHASLHRWITRHYRDRLHPDDLADPALLEESRRALDQLTHILGLPSIYPFQTAK